MDSSPFSYLTGHGTDGVRVCLLFLKLEYLRNTPNLLYGEVRRELVIEKSWNFVVSSVSVKRSFDYKTSC